MPTLDKKKIEKNKKRKKRVFAFWVLLCILSAPIVAEVLDVFLAGILGKNFGTFDFDFNYLRCWKLLVTQKNRLVLCGLYAVCILLIYLYESSMEAPKSVQTATVQVTHNIEIPVAVGNGQYGNARFQTEDEKRETYSEYVVNNDEKPTGGIVVEQNKVGGKEIIRYLTDPIHAIILAATRRGKTRRVFLPTIWLNILAGVNMAITDCKGEIYLFTHLFAKVMGYTERVFDLRDPDMGQQYNYMQQVVKYLEDGDISEATEKTWDLVSVLVGEAKGEKIWNDGECSTIAAAIMIVAQDAPENCKNLTNVYYFLAYMCEPDPETGEMPINTYIERLPDNHPAKAAFQVAKIAPYRTRSSFFTSALATLRLFTDWKIADMTSQSDYDLSTLDDQKTITYIIVPDEKETRYSLAALYINQLYVAAMDIAAKKGGSLDRRMEFILDEFGNFPPIPGMGSMMSAGAGRNVFFRLVLQDYQQLKKNYPEDYGNIRGNADLTIYLGSTDHDTLQEISKDCDTYTVEVGNVGTSANDSRKRDGVNYSAGSSMTSRYLLYPSDVGKIEAPDALVLYGSKHPAIMYLPDLSEYQANDDFGLGDQEYNKQLMIQRSQERLRRKVVAPALWGVWKEILAEIAMQNQLAKQIAEEEKQKKKEAKEANKKVSLM